MKYLYFNKTTFKRLIKLWRRVCPNNALNKYDDNTLIEHWTPLRFIEDIEREVNAK